MMRDLFTPTGQWTQINLPDADVSVLHGLALPDGTLDGLTTETVWRQDDIVIFGKRVRQPRLHAWHGDPEAVYVYSGLRNLPLPWTPLLLDIKARVEAACGARFNSALLNLYRDGNDSMGAHSDDEPELGPLPVIASLSLGATRRFNLKHRFDTQQPTIRISLGDGDLLLMKGATQAHWKHSISKDVRLSTPRINLTFRAVTKR